MPGAEHAELAAPATSATPAGRRASLSARPLFTNIVRIRLRATGSGQQLREVLRLDREARVDRHAACPRRRRTGSRAAPGSCASSSSRRSAVAAMKAWAARRRRHARRRPARGSPSGPTAARARPPLEHPAPRRARRSRRPARPRARGPASALRCRPSCLPSRISCSASAMPISRGMRCVPPPPGSRPTFTSGRPTTAFGSSAITR